MKFNLNMKGPLFLTSWSLLKGKGGLCSESTHTFSEMRRKNNFHYIYQFYSNMYSYTIFGNKAKGECIYTGNGLRQG